MSYIGMSPLTSFGPNSISDFGALSVNQLQNTIGTPMQNNPMNQGNQGLGTGLDWNIGTGQLALGGLSTLGNLWSGLNAMNLATKQFKFTKDVTNTNLNNQISSYNTALADRARARGVAEGQSQDQVNDYVNRNSLHR